MFALRALLEFNLEELYCSMYSLLVCFYSFWNLCYRQIHFCTSEYRIFWSQDPYHWRNLTDWRLLVERSSLPIFRNFYPVNGHLSGQFFGTNPIKAQKNNNPKSHRKDWKQHWYPSTSRKKSQFLSYFNITLQSCLWVSQSDSLYLWKTFSPPGLITENILLSVK